MPQALRRQSFYFFVSDPVQAVKKSSIEIPMCLSPERVHHHLLQHQQPVLIRKEVYCRRFITAWYANISLKLLPHETRLQARSNGTN